MHDRRDIDASNRHDTTQGHQPARAATTRLKWGTNSASASVAGRDLASVVDVAVATASQYALVSRVILFGSYGKGLATDTSDLDLLVLVAPPWSAQWNPKSNVALRSTLCRALGDRAHMVDLSVRTIDQYEEAHTVPVCPEHSAASEGTIVWSSAISRPPRVTRSVLDVRRDNALDWLRFAWHASEAMRSADAQQAHRVIDEASAHTSPTDHPKMALRHHEKCLRAAIVAWAIATESAIPDHTLPLSRLANTVEHAFGQALGDTIADIAPLGRARSAAIAVAVATESTRELRARVRR
jgi:predicted nucleotidyltransferase